ncbi:MAG TPA: hypothetical protein VFZ61_11530 [Polyangiales bacterium]
MTGCLYGRLYILVVWLLLTLPQLARAQATCDARALADLLLNTSDQAVAAAQLACPLPDHLLPATSVDALTGQGVREPEQVRAALSELARATREAGTAWSAAFADKLSEQRDVACDQTQSLDFTTTYPSGDDDTEGCDCLWVSGRAGSQVRTCYRVGTTDAPACEIAQVTFASWPKAAPALAAQRLGRSGLIKLSKSCRDQARKVLRDAHKAWNNLRDNGYLQYPWELAASRAFKSYRNYQDCFNSDPACRSDGLMPERWRLVFFHPALGIAFSGFGKQGKPSADAAAALLLELAGFTLYPSDFKYYFGLSAGAAVLGANFGEPRVGGLVHLTRWVHVGYYWCVAGEHARDASLIASFDVASWVGKLMNKNFLQ